MLTDGVFRFIIKTDETVICPKRQLAPMLSDGWFGLDTDEGPGKLG